MKFRKMSRKLLFMNHIIHLGEDSLAKQIQIAQKENDSPGLTREVEEFIVQLGLPNCLNITIKKNKWKRLVKKAIAEANEKDIRESMKNYKKVNQSVLENETFGCQEYIRSLTLSQARTLVKHKYSMNQHVKMNCKGDQLYAKSLWQCGQCKSQDSELHLLWCSGYKKLREGLDLSRNSDLCNYLQNIYKLRCEAEND